MDINQAIELHASQPLTHQLMLSFLADYKRPNDKIHSMLNDGSLTSVKKGLYIAGSKFGHRPEPFLIANHIFGPSYVSADVALSYYGLIPERVYEVTCMTPQSTRKFNTLAGTFSYTHLPIPYYSFGMRQVKLSGEQYAMIASPEKALFDKIVTSPGIVLRSKKEASEYLVENLRMDEEGLKAMNKVMMQGWLPYAPKQNSLLMAIKMLNGL